MPKNLKYVYYPEKKVYILAKTSKDEFLSDPADSKGTAIVHRSTEKNNMERLYKSRSSFKITNISEQSKSKWATILYGGVFPVSDLSNVAKNNNKGGGNMNMSGSGYGSENEGFLLRIPSLGMLLGGGGSPDKAGWVVDQFPMAPPSF